MLAEAFREQGHRTVVAHDGPSALRIAAGAAIDAAFLDIGLPVMDGYELASRLRQFPHLAGMQLIAVTGYGQESDRRRTRAAGFDHHLVKPITIDLLPGILGLGRPQAPA